MVDGEVDSASESEAGGANATSTVEAAGSVFVAKRLSLFLT